jgi:fructosamine-3-kinase
MLSASHQANAKAALAAVQSLRCGRYRASTVAETSVHACFHISDGEQSYFAKVAHHPKAKALLKAEADGLRAMAATGSVRTPEVLLLSSSVDDTPTPQTLVDNNSLNDPSQTYSCLVLEFLPMKTGEAGAALGQALAGMHRCHADTFGWNQDNYLGMTPQSNRQQHDIVQFMAEQRIGYQLKLAQRDGLNFSILDQGWQLVERIHQLYHHYHPHPSLVHGDLWHGNQGCLSDGTPVIFDPAVHFGDPEADLAMAELFGGFSRDFFAAYRDHAGIDDGYSLRKNLHQLYHVLNHHHLFGSSYAGQAQRLIQGSLAGLK